MYCNGVENRDVRGMNGLVVTQQQKVTFTYYNGVEKMDVYGMHNTVLDVQQLTVTRMLPNGVVTMERNCKTINIHLSLRHFRAICTR